MPGSARVTLKMKDSSFVGSTPGCVTVNLSNHGFLDEVDAVPFSGPDQPASPLPARVAANEGATPAETSVELMRQLRRRDGESKTASSRRRDPGAYRWRPIAAGDAWRAQSV